MKSHRLESEDSFTGLVHWFNLILEPSGRADRAKLTLRIDHHRHGVHARGSSSANSSDEGSLLRSVRANPDGSFLVSNALIADVDIVKPKGEINTRCDAQRDVIVATRVIKERVKTERGVV